MFCAFFHLLIYYSLANEDLRHFYPTDKRFNDQIQRKLSSNIKFKEITCPEFDKDTFTEIFDGVNGVTGATGNHYACNLRFKKPISISNGVLQIYHCKFTNFKSAYSFQNTPISIKTVTEGDVYISNCEFFVCEAGCIYLDQVNVPKLEIKNCYFTLCVSSYNYAIIQFNSNSGTIENCYFRNNYGSPADIYYNPSEIGDNNRLKITNCVYQISASRESAMGSSCFLYLKSGSKIEFTNNDFYIWTAAKIFASKITNPNDQIFDKINMYPYDDNNIGSTLPDGFSIGNGETMTCPENGLPEGMPSVPPNFFCGNIGDQTDSTLLKAYSFVQVYYSSFNTFKNDNGDGGAAYIKIPNQPSIERTLSIKFYNSVFVSNSAQNGCAIYIESSDKNRLFDFYQCTFDSNKLSSKALAGGAICIKATVSSFKFTDCVFINNYAKDGGAIYYLSDGADESTDKNIPSIQVSDCYFYHNRMYNSGGALSLNIKNNLSPRHAEINNCTFLDNSFVDDDTTKDAPEFGGAIYYSYEYQSTDASTSQTEKYLHVFDCFFMQNGATIYGGAICLLINGPDKSIEIERCSFDGNYAYFYSQEYSGKGGAIYYSLDQALQTTNTDASLNIHDCYFTNCFAPDQGASISIVITNSQSSKSIEINNCLFNDYDDSASGNTKPNSKVSKNGAFISYVIDLSSNYPSLHINECNFAQEINRFINDDEEIEKGGCIYLLVNNCQQTGSIVIDGCSFSHKKSTAYESYGGSIYYRSHGATGSNSQVLSISNSEFSGSEVKNNGGSIYFELTEDDSQKEITLNNCSFKQTTSTINNDAIYIKSDKKSHNFKFTECTFDSCMISFNALSTSIENCRFNEIGSDKHAVFYTSSYTEDLERSLTISSCNFTQTSSTVDSLVYFNTKLSSKFVFTYNDIKFTDNTSHVLGCNANILIQEDEEKYWEFHNNTLDPNDEVVIKTSDAEKIPAYCITGFSCIPVPKNCEENNRCDLTNENNEQFPKQVLNEREYDGLSTEEANVKHGGAIHLINYQLECKESHFTNCKAEQGGGGGIFIVVQKKPNEQKSFLIEKCTFKECAAKFGGGIYIFSDQQSCDFQINQCIFESNAAELTANDHLFGGGAMYLQTLNSKLIRCTFRKNVGINVKIYQTDNLDPPSSNSLLLNSESSIRVSECTFESDKDSSASSLFFVDRKIRNKTPLAVVNCMFVGELPKGAYHIDGESNNKGKLNLMVEKCKFSYDRKTALNSKLNILSFDLESQEFNYKENESNNVDSIKQRKNGSNLMALMAIEVSAVIVASLAIVIIIKKKDSQVVSSDIIEQAEL